MRQAARSDATPAALKTTPIRTSGRIEPLIRPCVTSVHVAYPGVDYQVEVYDPKAGAALELIDSGGIVPVHGGVDPSAPLGG